MIIPDSLRIGKVHYTVYEPLFSPKPHTYGSINYLLGNIYVAQRHPHNRRVRTPAQRSGTFWHEVTHGILYDMRSPLFNDEKFVTAFAQRLSATINSARFE